MARHQRNTIPSVLPDLFGLYPSGTFTRCPDNHQRALAFVPGSLTEHYCTTCNERLGPLTTYWR